jgi:arsenate reductase-like glutaredoxin family protein
MKAREFLAQNVAEEGLALRNLIKEPLSADELRVLASRVGGAQHLVAPKRRGEAEGLDGEKLLKWLAGDGARVRRPIVVTGKTITLGFSDEARKELQDAL